MGQAPSTPDASPLEGTDEREVRAVWLHEPNLASMLSRKMMLVQPSWLPSGKTSRTSQADADTAIVETGILEGAFRSGSAVTMPGMTGIHQIQLPNGLWLVAEPIAEAQSLAMTLLVPTGSSTEPEDQQGVGSMLAEMICRGAGGLDARAHSDALDELGIQRETDVWSIHLTLDAIMIASKLDDAFPLLANMVYRPRLEASTLQPSRDLVLQALDALEDEPQERVLIDLRQRHLPSPFGRCHLGRRDHVESIELEQVRTHWAQRCTPDGAVLAFAGRFDFQQLRDLVEAKLGHWAGRNRDEITGGNPERGYVHREADSAQVHIGIAYDAVPEPDEQSVFQQAAQVILSGGSSTRLFSEVREKRGLCYAVYAAYVRDRDRGMMLSYAGTTAPRAQETLDVLVQELRRLSEGIEEDEFERAMVGMKSRLVMQGESTSARARAIAMDQHVMGRPRGLAELAARIDGITVNRLRDFAAEHPPGRLTIVTIGPSPLQVNACTS